MKKSFVLLTVAALCFALTACACDHEWEDANCTTPKTCSECNETKGDALGHKWVNATCENAKYCSVCETSEGEPLGHAWSNATCTTAQTCSTCQKTKGAALGHKPGEWTVKTEATCSEVGTETSVCSVCQETITQEIAKLDHTPGEWEITKEPTENTEGTQTKKCKVCGEEVESQKFTLSAEEIKQRYKNSCQRISYDSLSRTPDNYKGSRIKFSGYVVQVCSEASSSLYYSTYRVATSGRYNNVVYIKVDNYGSGSRILEDDYITFYGESDGLYSYTTVMGSTLTIPSITVAYID